MPRYVVQQHFRQADDWHYDLMLERGEALVTFSSGVPPDRTEELPCLVRHLGDHRLAYLEQEGEISRGRGWCRIHDRGTFDWISPPAERPIPSQTLSNAKGCFAETIPGIISGLPAHRN